MSTTSWNADELRMRFCLAMSDMYRNEVPLYGDLVRIVNQVDESVLSAQGKKPSDVPTKHNLERHGAIRLGCGHELRLIKRLFSLFGMYPVGYYDLTVVDFPLHATAFRPISLESLRKNPFRVFVSVLRKDLIAPRIRPRVEEILGKRQLFSPRLVQIIDRAEMGTAMTAKDADGLIMESLKVFQWHSRSAVTMEDYLTLKKEHAMIADIVCFPSAHINHLTPRTLDIDLVQAAMVREGLPAKEAIEGPPRRKCPILLRQTSFKALEEPVNFFSTVEMPVTGTHTARFGEVEQRGAAVTPRGRALYDELLGLASQRAVNGPSFEDTLKKAFSSYPDTWAELQARGLVYFQYTVTAAGRQWASDKETTQRPDGWSMEHLLTHGLVEYEPITYQDFLPLSAAGIFQSNLGDGSIRASSKADERDAGLSQLEEALGCKVMGQFELYNGLEQESIRESSEPPRRPSLTMATNAERTAVEDNGTQRYRRKAVRKRAALACDECRTRKRRCDGVFPACGGCARRMSTCVYSSEMEARAWQSSTIQSLRSRLEELEAEASSRALGSMPAAPATPATEPGNVDDTPNQNDDGDTSIRNGSGDAPTLVSISKDHAVSHHHKSPDAPVYLEPRSFEKLMKPISRALDLKSNPSISPWPPSAPANTRNAGLAQNPATTCTCDSALNATPWCLPLRRVADSLVIEYFSSVHRMYPVLHQPTFRRQYERLWEPTGPQAFDCVGLCRKKNQCRLFSALVQAIFALATLLSPGRPEENVVQADMFFRQAQQLDFLDVLDDEVGLELVQLGLVMGFYLQSTERFSKCWNITGLTIRLAQNAGLHLDLAEARKKGHVTSRPTQVEYEMRSRVWYGCVVLEREVSVLFGRKLMAPIGGKGPRLPDSIDDDHLSGEPGKWNQQPKDLPSLLESFIQTTKLYHAFDELLDREELQEPVTPTNDGSPFSRATSSIRTLLDLDTTVMDWRDNLPTCLRYDPNDVESNRIDAATPRGLSIPCVHLLAQAKRLHLRFLHVRMLILRPALDLLFEKQQQESQTGASRAPRDARLEDVVLCNVASQCVASAQRLVAFLGAEIQSHDFLAWWYNISYLHNCASTILIGRLCNFGDGNMLEDSLSTSWELCLQCLSRYTELSSISKKSLHLLQESAKGLLSYENLQKSQKGTLAPSTARYPPLSAAQNPSTTQGAHVSGNTRPFQRDKARSPKFSTEGRPMDFAPPSDLDLDRLEGLDDEFGVAGDAEMSSWPFLPLLSQLEAMPLDFDIRILCPLHALPLSIGVGIPSNSKPVLEPRKMLIVVRNTQCGDDAVAECLEFLGEPRILLGSHDLDRNTNFLNLDLLQLTRMGRGDAVDELVGFGTKEENSPATVAESDAPDAAVLRAKGLGALNDLWAPGGFGVAREELWYVHLNPPALIVEDICGDNLAPETTSNYQHPIMALSVTNARGSHRSGM
ncbi:hypothetical protein B0J13DRAFT_613411 [Dactylonectria estremocensis]|uniref:2-oxoadipate dioxygenase/decarboxylase n=1 Tax=Dactylonectria estremocensis TaxID=1079267 RepID=A0A9P9ICJ5_9HYPO|nr:hypothetical protein B0J13DRAFT_613411 [Dactylonectria estremocensis]